MDLHTRDQLGFHAQLLSQIADAVVAVDMDGRNIFWNEGAERLYGVASDEAIGCRLSEICGHNWLVVPTSDRTAAHIAWSP